MCCPPLNRLNRADNEHPGQCSDPKHDRNNQERPEKLPGALQEKSRYHWNNRTREIPEEVLNTCPAPGRFRANEPLRNYPQT